MPEPTLTILTVEEIQQWLEATKFPVVAADAIELEKSAKAKVFGKLKSVFDTSTWIGPDVPPLIRTALSMLTASWLWRRQNPTAANERGNYGEQLEDSVFELLDGLVEGLFDLEEQDRSETSHPSFFPTDAATRLAEEDPNNPNGAKMAFTMGQVF